MSLINTFLFQSFFSGGEKKTRSCGMWTRTKVAKIQAKDDVVRSVTKSPKTVCLVLLTQYDRKKEKKKNRRRLRRQVELNVEDILKKATVCEGSIKGSRFSTVELRHRGWALCLHFLHSPLVLDFQTPPFPTLSRLAFLFDVVPAKTSRLSPSWLRV